MRFVIFSGLLLIHDAIAAQTGHVQPEDVIMVGAITLVASALMDIMEFIKGMNR